MGTYLIIHTLDLIKAATEKDVIIFCMPPHTTADNQPFGTSCFGPLKTCWFEICHQYLFHNLSRVITIFQFSSLFAQAWSKGMTINNIVSGFCSVGICPFTLKVILDKFPKPSALLEGSDSIFTEKTKDKVDITSTSTEKTNDKADIPSNSTEKTKYKADVTSLTPETINYMKSG